MLMYLDAGLPLGVLESLETERLWESCLAQYGKDAWNRWDRQRLCRERGIEAPESFCEPLCYPTSITPEKIASSGIYGPAMGMSSGNPSSSSASGQNRGGEPCRP
ncbi:hypothetical protein ACSSZE_18715 [Acidithiobacillus caldus]